MLQNYFKIAIRNLVNNKVFSFINIAGLAVGTVVCLLIVLFIRDESRFDTFSKQVPQIYQVNPNGWKALHPLAYAIDIRWGMYAVTGLAMLLIAVLTVSYQTVRTALMNPVISLKSE